MYSLTNKNAGPEACSLYQYINSIRGKAILSGQQEFPGDHNHGEELAYIRQVSGHSPAILGLDYISNDFEGVNRRAIAWHQKGGIVSICWHWGIPPYGLGYEKQVLNLLKTMPYVTPNTLIVIEASLETDFSYLESLGYDRKKEKCYKSNKHIFCQKQ